jgi:DNA-binding response OmpR family regulator
MNGRTNDLKNKATILIVEDSLTQAEQLRYILEQHLYNTEVAHNGKQALAILSERKPELIITDIVMPEMQGYELCQRIKSDENTRDIPVILVSSLTNTEDVLHGLACGADSLITKPYSEDYILSRIERILTEKTMSKNLRQKISIEVMLDGQKSLIETEYHQILNLLISSYEAAIIKNTELVKAEDSLKLMNDRLEETKISEDAGREYAESIINTVREPLIVLDQDLRIVSVSRSFYEVFKVKPEETIGQLIYDLGNKQWDMPKLRELLEDILPKKAAFDNYEIEHDFTTIGRRVMLLNARQIKRGMSKERIILLAIEFKI